MCTSDLQEIPKIFYSYQTQSPFSECLVCSCYLLDNQTYVIEKALKKHPGYTAKDVIFDYAICLTCALKIREQFSKNSLDKINAYFSKHIVISPPSKKEVPININSYLDHCIVKKFPIAEITDFQIYAYCHGNKLIQDIPPYLISQSAIEEIIPLVSNKTQNILNDFYDRYFSPDPEMLLPQQPSDQLIFI